MSAIHVCLSSFFDDRGGRRTGLSRFELGLAAEFVKAGAELVTYSAVRGRMVALEFQRNISPIVRHQDALNESAHWKSDKKTGTRTLRMPVSLSRRGASQRRSVAAHIHAMLLSPRAAIAPGDTLVVPGIVWSGAALAELRRLHREYRVRIVPFVHDLIPIRRPEFHTNKLGIFRFRRYAETMGDIAERICVSSNFVADDVRAFLVEESRGEIPIVKVNLCPDITLRTERHSTPRLAALKLEPGGYALYVSTLNVRKNHAGLYAIWRHLATVAPKSTLPLVIAGQRGWGVDDLLRQMSADAAIWNRSIRFVESPNDAEVAQLYADCAFTVFPSHYEGWGLGVTESLEFGKPCIAADSAALAEAGQSLAIHLDPLDGIGWMNAISRLSSDRAYLHELSARIQRQYKPRTWQDVGRDMLTAVTAERPCSALDASRDLPR